MDDVAFWRRKTLAEMTQVEWESLCDGCGRCCLVKLEEDLPPAQIEAGAVPRIFFTDVGCKLLDGETCRCRDYPDRSAHVPDCVRLTPQVVETLGWLPSTCAYRLVAQGGDLYWWHPLVSGDPDTVHDAGISVRHRVGASEEEVPFDKLEDHIVSWPLRWPKRARETPPAQPPPRRFAKG
jgi:uncharacterized cysteine cluster protein YcgN (CxxCxxCC family)